MRIVILQQRNSTRKQYSGVFYFPKHKAFWIDNTSQMLPKPIRPINKHKNMLDKFLWNYISFVKQLEIKLMASYSIDLVKNWRVRALENNKGWIGTLKVYKSQGDEGKREWLLLNSSEWFEKWHHMCKINFIAMFK